MTLDKDMNWLTKLLGNEDTGSGWGQRTTRTVGAVSSFVYGPDGVAEIRITTRDTPYVGYGTRVYLDGVEVSHVRAVAFTLTVDDVTASIETVTPA